MIRDSEYDNELLNELIKNPELSRRLAEALEASDDDGEGKIWLGSLVDNRPGHTQIQLVVTRITENQIDEDE